MIAKIKQKLLILTINFLFALLAWIRNEKLFRWSYTGLLKTVYGRNIIIVKRAEIKIIPVASIHPSFP
jgi:hypothetical protein